MRYKYLFTDFHANLHHEQMNQLEDWYEFAKEMLDFWPIAYYPYYMRRDEKTGMMLEDIYSPQEVEADWKRIKEFSSEMNIRYPQFPMFNGYEWQGMGLDGDHNVYFKGDGPLVTPGRYEELYQQLKDHACYAIPHHLAYALGHRGKNWSTHRESFSPFAEIYSCHGSSESGYGDMDMGRHIHMGPRTGGTSVFDGLKLGKKVGIIASGDNHQVPAQYGHGFAGVLAEENTADGIWEALAHRRVYGMSKGRVNMLYEIDGHMMGQEFSTAKASLNHRISLECQHGIDRVVIFKNEIPCFTYAHSQVWMNEPVEDYVKVKFDVEFGWGPDLSMYPDIQIRHWNAKLTTGANLLSVNKCWTSRGQRIISQDEHACEMELTTMKTTQSGKWMGPSPVTSEGFTFEVEGALTDEVVLEVNGMVCHKTIADLLDNTDLMVFIEDAKKLAKDIYGLEDYYRSDPYYHNAYKVRIRKAVPENGYRMERTFDLDFEGDANYLIKAYEQDGSVAWSSPIWITKE